MNTDYIDQKIQELQQDNVTKQRHITLLNQQIKMNERLIREYEKGKEAMMKANADSTQTTA